MTVKQKLAIYMGLITLLIAVLTIWGYFAYRGKTDVTEFIAQLAGLVTIIMSAIAALGGFHSAQSGINALNGMGMSPGILVGAVAPADTMTVNQSEPATPQSAPEQ